MTEHKFCPRCHEEIYEGNIATHTDTAVPEITTLGKATAKTLREEINHLRYNIHDTHSMMLVNKLTDIFNLIADYIEEH
jgi:hypothetical protein